MRKLLLIAVQICVFALFAFPTISRAEIALDTLSKTLTAPQGKSYQWYYNNQKINGATAQQCPLNQSGFYSVEVKTQDGKVISQEVLIQVNKGKVRKIYLVGDSTVMTYKPEEAPQTGWGQVLPFFIDKTKFEIHNHAMGGRSSKSFIGEKRWKNVTDSLQKDDYVFIQFGHNDGKKEDSARYTQAFTTYKQYISQYVNDTKAKGAIPILVTPMHRNSWKEGKVYNSWHDYPEAMRQVAKELNVPLVDLHKKSEVFFESVGENYVTNFVVLNLKGGEFSGWRFINGVKDNVHFQEMGAIEMAKFICEGLKEMEKETTVKDLVPALMPLYDVTISSTNEKAATITKSGKYPAGVNVTLRSMTNDGFNFLSWESDGKIISDSYLYQFKMPAQNCKFQANYETAQKTSLEIEQSIGKQFVVFQANAFLENIKITDSNSKVIFEKTISKTNTVNVDRNLFSKGTYFAEIKTAQGTIIKSLTIK